MKIALLYSGHIRTLANTLLHNVEYFKTVAPQAQIDLYFSVWDTVGYVDHLNDERHVYSDHKTPANCKDIRKEIINICNSLPVGVNLINIKIQAADDIAPKALPQLNIDALNLKYQYYKMQDCFELIEQPKDYNIIVRMRCDVLLRNPIPAEVLQNALRKNEIILNKYVWQVHSSPVMENEMFFMGNPTVMQKACKLPNNVHKINTLLRNGHIQPFGESLFYGHLLSNNFVSTNSTHFDFNYQVLR